MKISKSLWIYRQIKASRGGFPPVEGKKVMFKAETGYEYHWLNLETYGNWLNRMSKIKQTT